MGKRAQRAASRTGGKNNKIWFGPKGFFALPRDLMDMEDYQKLTSVESRLLQEAMYQYNGSNNGNLSFAYSDMKHRGFNSKSSLERARLGLVNKGFLQITRQGYSGKEGRRLCTLYAITWIPVQEISGIVLDVPPTKTPQLVLCSD